MARVWVRRLPRFRRVRFRPRATVDYRVTSTSEVRLTLNGQTTTVTPAYTGLSGFPGLHQIVFQVPNIANGDYETVLVVNGIASPTRAFLPISQ